jgi:hypothetical protein
LEKNVFGRHLVSREDDPVCTDDDGEELLVERQHLIVLEDLAEASRGSMLKKFADIFTTCFTMFVSSLS